MALSRSKAFWGVLAAACVLPSEAHATITLNAAVTDLDTTVVANGLAQPTDMAELPDGRVVITQRLGDVVVVDTNGDQLDAGTITVAPEFGEQGLLGVVADPDFANNGYLYFYASSEPTSGDPKNKHKVYKIKLGADSRLDSARDTIIDKGLRASRSSVDGGASNHNGGGLVIYKNQLYLSVGDTGHNKTPPNNELATCLNATNGKILRVNLDGSTPSDNPLASFATVTGCTDWNTALTNVAPEMKVFAWGFRNPYRFWIDPQTSRMWIGDVGETTREEISLGSPIDGNGAGAQGEHFGWPFKEGTTEYTTAQQPFQPADACLGITPARDCVPPVYDYGHGNNNNCVIGGLIPDGCGWAAPWTSRYLFGDNGSGRIWYLEVNGNRDGLVNKTAKDFATSGGVGSFRMGSLGALYIVEVSGGAVSKITPKGLDVTLCTPMGSGGTGGMGGTGGSGALGGTTGDAGAGDSGGTGGTPSTGGT
ncbi:MAG TPA: PQQ-dependent sugar dehydrogenase, partial [Polyangiaceae bacterium]|nr:PQQ-dependent sugar dehydrogenase [Polyangiaceae bacterium]